MKHLLAIAVLLVSGAAAANARSAKEDLNLSAGPQVAASAAVPEAGAAAAAEQKAVLPAGQYYHDAGPFSTEAEAAASGNTLAKTFVRLGYTDVNPTTVIAGGFYSRLFYRGGDGKATRVISGVKVFNAEDEMRKVIMSLEAQGYAILSYSLTRTSTGGGGVGLDLIPAKGYIIEYLVPNGSVWKQDKSCGETVLLRLRLQDGSDAEIVGGAPVVETAIVKFESLRLRSGGRTYRIDNSSPEGFLKELCKPYASKYPYTYHMAETKGMFEKGVAIGNDLVAYPSKNDAVYTHAYCQREPY